MSLRYPKSISSDGHLYLTVKQKALVEFGYGHQPPGKDQHSFGLLAPGEGMSECYIIPSIARRLGNQRARMIIHVSPYNFLAAYVPSAPGLLLPYTFGKTKYHSFVLPGSSSVHILNPCVASFTSKCDAFERSTLTSIVYDTRRPPPQPFIPPSGGTMSPSSSTSIVGASDASAAPCVINTNRTPTSRRRRQDDDEDEEDAAALVRPLVQSIRDFAKDEDRRQDALLKSQSDKRVFRRRAQLVDEARKYRRLIAELDSNDPRSSSLSDFYKKESLKIEEKICNLDSGS
ncbi:hypothetical protein MHU86_19117 [Fragilaria crotonensis]|nr:hypothetical protein MHU86_19117 [Fragilaria crotonensis]